MNALFFPMEHLRITQGYGLRHDGVAADTYSHAGTCALDLGGADNGADWLVAPCDMTVRRVYGAYNAVWFESDEVYEPVGSTIMLLCLHINNADRDALGLKVGKHFAQGERCYREGCAGNVTGTHVHLELGRGPMRGTGWAPNSCGVWQINDPLIPSEHLQLLRDVQVLDGHGYAWRRYAYPEQVQPLPAPLSTKAVYMRCTATGGDRIMLHTAAEALCIDLLIEGNTLTTAVPVTAGDQRQLMAAAALLDIAWHIYEQPVETALEEPKKPTEDEKAQKPAEEEKSENRGESAGETEAETTTEETETEGDPPSKGNPHPPLTADQQAIVDMIARAQVEAEENAQKQRAMWRNHHAD